VFEVLSALLRRLFNRSPNTQSRAQLGTNGSQGKLREGSNTTEHSDGHGRSDLITSAKTSTTPVQGIVYDKTLLERSYTQWQFGDWKSLCQLNEELIQGHPDREKLALLAAAGNYQLGNESIGQQYTHLAQSWGVDANLINKILISGVCNNLGRAASFAGQNSRVAKHFSDSIETGILGADWNLITKVRVSQQQEQLGLQDPDSFETIGSGKVQNLLTFNIKTVARHDLGNAWAGNTVNTVIFRHHGILTHENTQFTAFYVNAQTLRLVQRELTSEKLITHDLVGEYNLRDAHNSISMGVDRLGHLHLSYDHHATTLRYRRSIRPLDISEWTGELKMTGVHENKVTYPTFITPHHNSALILLYRDGIHDKGSARIKSYDEKTQTWTDYPTAILSGSEQKPWTSNAYWNHPAVGSDGSLHLSFVWRTHTLGEEKLINNINIGFAYSNDNGLTWVTSKNRPYQLPITQVNAETIYPISPGSNLMNQCSMALDSLNRPHIVFYCDDLNDVPQYQHLWFDGKVWHHQFVSNRTKAFSLQGGGTLQIPISRPEIVIDRQNNVFIITRGDHTGNRLAATFLPAPNYTYQKNNIKILSEDNIGFAEPIVDRQRWQQVNVLTVLIQRNEQPNQDKDILLVKHPVQLLDFYFELNKLI